MDCCLKAIEFLALNFQMQIRNLQFLKCTNSKGGKKNSNHINSCSDTKNTRYEVQMSDEAFGNPRRIKRFQIKTQPIALRLAAVCTSSVKYFICSNISLLLQYSLSPRRNMVSYLRAMFQLFVPRDRCCLQRKCFFVLVQLIMKHDQLNDLTPVRCYSRHNCPNTPQGFLQSLDFCRKT